MIIKKAISDIELAEVFKIQKEVFIEEQGVPPERDRDGKDTSSHHWLIYESDIPIGLLVYESIPHKRLK